MAALGPCAPRIVGVASDGNLVERKREEDHATDAFLAGARVTHADGFAGGRIEKDRHGVGRHAEGVGDVGLAARLGPALRAGDVIPLRVARQRRDPRVGGAAGGVGGEDDPEALRPANQQLGDDRGGSWKSAEIPITASPLPWIIPGNGERTGPKFRVLMITLTRGSSAASSRRIDWVRSVEELSMQIDSESGFVRALGRGSFSVAGGEKYARGGGTGGGPP